MPEIYTAAWYDSLKEILNRSEQVIKKAPAGLLHVLAEIKGDNMSPYLAAGEVKRFIVDLDHGRCTEYREVTEAPPKRDFDFVLELTASLFESIVANQADPVKAGLKGDIKITGDMRILIQHADLVDVLRQIYVKELETEWPKGKPPYR
ncbi:MAG: SCP2 sterol-binding domain-containing protein [Dehalococcoidia bacterium]